MEPRNEIRILRDEEKVLVIERRLFQGDARRHFIGIVEHYDGAAMRVRGNAFVYDVESSSFVRRKQQRTRIIPLDNNVVVIVLADDVDLSRLRYEATDGREQALVDGKGFSLELGELAAQE